MIWYAYQDDDGSYYYPIAFTNANGKVETNWKNFTLYEDTTYDTLYRKFDELLPYKFNEDYSKVTFTFRPADYNNLPNNISSVHLMSNFTEGGWDPADVNKLTKSSDGNYSITLNTTDIYNMWPTFKFIVNEVNWFGGIEFKYNLPSENIEGENADFKVIFPEPTISFDLNGGEISCNLETFYSTSEYLRRNISDVFNKNLNLQNPTKDGFVFAGWTLTNDGNVYVQEIPFGKITVYAKWLEQKTCTLTLDASGYGYYLNKNGEEVSILEIPFETGDNF
ncbi:MAG: InlB B-repeat-containing protein [Treponemataceae bacterium]|nr:InlB B-repeat-containing protein [Treponemataceae bacterium]